MTDAELCHKLCLTVEQLAELRRRGLPHRGSGSRRKYEPALVREWLIAEGIADTTHAPVEPFTLRTIGEVAKYFCVSEKTVGVWLREGMPGRPGPRGKQDGFFAVHEMREWLTKRQQTQANSLGGTSERDRLVAVKRQREELKLGTESGNLLPVETVGKTFLRANHEARTQLEQLPASIVKLLPHTLDRETRDRVRKKVKQAIDHVARTLADALENLSAEVIPPTQGESDDQE
jgi:phage terminase Nu1 subunit (DNA packaging protein)